MKTMIASILSTIAMCGHLFAGGNRAVQADESTGVLKWPAAAAFASSNNLATRTQLATTGTAGIAYSDTLNTSMIARVAATGAVMSAYADSLNLNMSNRVSVIEPYTNRVILLEPYTNRVVTLESNTNKVIVIESGTNRWNTVTNKAEISELLSLSNTVKSTYYPSSNPSNFISALVGEPLWMAASGTVVYLSLFSEVTNNLTTNIVSAGTWTGSNYATKAYAAGLTNGLIQLGDIPAQTNASFARTGEVMALAAPLTNGYIKAGDVPADNLNWQTQMVERVSTNGAEWGSHAGLYPASNPSGYVDRASATQGMQVAGDYATGTPLYVESDGLPNVLARNNTLGSTNFVWSLGMTNAPLAWTFATTGFSNVPGVVEVPRWADTSYALKFRYRNQDYIPDLPSEQTNFLFMGSLPIVQAGYGLEGSLFKLNGQKVDFLLDSGNIGWFLRANTNLLVISGVNLGGQSITNVATNSIYFTDGTSLSAADVRKAQSSLATNGSGAVLTGITASQVGAVATNDARYLAALTNASAFDAAGSAAGITNGLPSGTNMTGSVFVNGRLTSLGTNAPWAGSMTNLVLSNAAPCSSTFAAGTLTLGTNAASSSGTAYTFLNTNQNAGTVWTNAGSSVVLIGTNVPAGGGISASDATNISASVQSAVAYTPLILTYAATTTLASATNYQALVLTGPVYLALPAVNTNILQTIRLDLIAGTNSVTFAAGITNSANVTISTSKTTPLLFDQPYKQTYWTVYGF